MNKRKVVKVIKFKPRRKPREVGKYSNRRRMIKLSMNINLKIERRNK